MITQVYIFESSNQQLSATVGTGFSVAVTNISTTSIWEAKIGSPEKKKQLSLDNTTFILHALFHCRRVDCY